jgi:hypothetical protein
MSEADFVAFADDDGNYYVLTRALIESGRVADEDRAELEEFLSADVSGFAFDIGRSGNLSNLAFGGAFTAPSSLTYTRTGSPATRACLGPG